MKRLAKSRDRSVPERHDRSDDQRPFYGRVLDELKRSRIPFMVGGAYGFERYTAIQRYSRDFDVFVMPGDARRVLDHFAARGYGTAFSHPHWLGKIRHGTSYVDVIFSSGNGVASVDQAWFDHAPRSVVFGRRVLLCPVEEMIWSKSFVMERERFDGADILHLIHSCSERIDWRRLLDRFGPFWEVLLGHLIFFGFVYPAERNKVPKRVLRGLLDRIEAPGASPGPVCRGTLFSRSQYLPDLAAGYLDARLVHGTMPETEIEPWTALANDIPTLATGRKDTAARWPRRPPSGRRR